jgi:enoyl-CoA hydratase
MANEIIVEKNERVGIARLNRPDKLNALNIETMTQLVDALEAFDADDGVRSILLTGSDRAFAAGADIGEMSDAGMVEMYHRNQFARWERLSPPSADTCWAAAAS